MGLKILYNIIAICLTFLMSCSSKEKKNIIHGKWETINNTAHNSKIIMDIADSTILTEFYFHSGIKKVQFKYKVLNQEKTSFLLETINPFGEIEVDSLIYLDSLIRLSTEDNKNILLKRSK